MDYQEMDAPRGYVILKAGKELMRGTEKEVFDYILNHKTNTEDATSEQHYESITGVNDKYED